MGRLIFLAALVLLVLTVVFTVRAIRASRLARQINKDYEVLQVDRGNSTYIEVLLYPFHRKVEAVISLDDPDYSNRVIEEFGKAQAKVDDWNSTRRAISQ